MKCLLILLTLCAMACKVEAFTKPIESYGSFCLFKNVTQEDTLSGSYIVSGYDERKVDFRLFSPDNRMIEEIERQREGKFSFTVTEDGGYKLCFYNMGKSNVFVSFEVATSMIDSPAEKGIEKDQINNMNEYMDQAVRILKEVETGLSFQEIRDRIHHLNLEAMASKLNWSTFAKLFTLTVIGAGQLFLFSRFFKKRDQFRV